MKKISIILFTLLIFLHPSFAAENKNEVLKKGVINFYSGPVAIVRDGKTFAPEIGATVSQGMKIETGVNSFIEIYFGNNIVKVMGKSSVTISKLIYDIKKSGHATELYIARGKVFSNVAEKLSKNDRYIVKTVTTTAAVRGTEFLVSQDEGKGAISCLNGKIEVKEEGDASLNPVMLEGGNAVEFVRGKNMFVHALSQKNISELRGILESVKVLRGDVRKKIADENMRIKGVVQQLHGSVEKTVDDQKLKFNNGSGNVKDKSKNTIYDMKKVIDEVKQKTHDAAEKVKDETRKFTD